MNTKLHAVTDAAGRPIRVFVTAGQVSDYTGAAALLCGLPVRHSGPACSLTTRTHTRCLPDRRPPRSPRDAVPMMPWSGLLPIHIEHANEMGTSELH